MHYSGKIREGFFNLDTESSVLVLMEVALKPPRGLWEEFLEC
jgi:hypothetical protein